MDGDPIDAALAPDAPIDAPADAAIDAPIDASTVTLMEACLDADYTLVGTRFFRFVGPGLQWPEAEADCENDLGPSTSNAASTHLAVLRSAPEQDAVSVLGLGGDLWIGYTDRRAESELRWVTDEPGQFNPQVDGNNDGKDCVQIRSGSLQFRDCTEMESYVCECDAFPANPTSY
jgi:hypothetical protein